MPFVVQSEESLCRESPRGCRGVEAATDSTQTNEHGCVPILFYLWTLTFEFHIIFKGHSISFDFFFSPNHLEMSHTKQAVGGPDLACGS